MLGAVSLCAAALAQETPPEPAREFRGLWVATVNNIDWPSKEGLKTKEQQAELIAILDRAVALHMNAILLQVRPDCDALYESRLEPWSEYLTGVMGRAPFPYYDPLEFAVREAHKRGLELHAWFNPYRVRSLDLKTPVSRDFVTARHPELVRRYGKYLWLDPTEEGTRVYSLGVVMDVVRRYDIDGVHFDDYFYPYKEKVNNKDLEFPDDAAWRRYAASGGRLSRNDWRRDNVDQFVRMVYQSIKAEKPWVKFGVSPFGIWRPKFPPQVKGFDAYDELFANSRKWLNNGWVDYMAPQLYWSVDAKEQSFAALLKWWAGENNHHRNLWAGIRVTGWRGVTDDTQEVIREIDATRRQPGATGNIFFSAKPLMRGNGKVAEALEKSAYVAPALVPASPWLVSSNPPKPVIVMKSSRKGYKLKWGSGNEYDPWQWVLAKKIGNQWVTEVLPGEANGMTYLTPKESMRPTTVALAAVDRCGNRSEWQRIGQDQTREE